jgi:hypothetical protein
MLEFPALLLRPGPAPADGHARGPTRTWTILDPATGEFLGTARWQSDPARAWWRWAARPQLTVCETIDESLVFTAHRRGTIFCPYWEVRDSEGHRVGRFTGPAIWDRSGQRLSLRFAATPDRQGTRFLDPAGREVARIYPDADGTRLTFADELKDSPFAKMLLLADVLERWV